MKPEHFETFRVIQGCPAPGHGKNRVRLIFLINFLINRDYLILATLAVKFLQMQIELDCKLFVKRKFEKKIRLMACLSFFQRLNGEHF